MTNDAPRRPLVQLCNADSCLVLAGIKVSKRIITPAPQGMKTIASFI